MYEAHVAQFLETNGFDWNALANVVAVSWLGARRAESVKRVK
jgi:hypothetical protein